MEFTHDPFGLHTEHMDVCQMCLRAIVVFFTALVLFRIAGTRTLGRQSAFDNLTLLIIGSILGRIVVTGLNFSGALASVLVIVLIHRLLSWLTFKSKRMGAIFKGEALPLFRSGEYVARNLARAHITQEDLTEALHEKIQADDMSRVSEIRLERSGEISFVKK